MSNEDVVMSDASNARAADVALNVAVAVAKSGFAKSGDARGENTPETFELLDWSGFEPITLADATELKTVCWGSASLPPKGFWLKQGFVLHPPEKLFAYGVKTPANGTKNFLMAVQAYFLKNLFFESKPKEVRAKPTSQVKRHSKFSKSGREDISEKNQRKGSFKTNQILRPNAPGQLEMLIGGIAEVIFKAAEGDDSIFCMLSTEANFEPNIHFSIDGYTEKIVFVRCKSFAELKALVKKYIYHLLMEKGSGLLCFLYSILLSRNFQRLREDLQDEVVNPLIDMRGDTHPGLINLVLFGKASPYYHNGTMLVKDCNGETHERSGINDRGDIGLLIWDHDHETTASLNVGSRLKTPILPLWVTLCNDVVGVLFNPNKDLMRSHDAEKRFSLYYYSNFEFKEGTAKETKLTVETSSDKRMAMKEFDDDDNAETLPLELLIRTKWEDCAINWNGVHPYI